LSHTVIYVSASEQAEELRLRLFRSEPSIVVVNGVDLEAMERLILQSPIGRESLGLTADDLVMGSVSRFDPVKRIKLLVETVQRLRAWFPRLELVLVGGGGDEERIRRRVLEMRLQKQVIFTGFLENPARVYRAFDLYVAASHKEGLRCLSPRQWPRASRSSPATCPATATS